MPTVPHTDDSLKFETQLRSLAAQATSRYPDEEARITRGLLLALAGHVTLHTDGSATVQSGSDAHVVYTVNGHCDCVDAIRAPAGRCKHRYAKTLMKRVRTPTPIPRVAYSATLKGEHGLAIRDEEGRVWFQGDNDQMVPLTDADRPNLQLHGRMDLAADARRADLLRGTDLARLDTARLAL